MLEYAIVFITRGTYQGSNALNMCLNQLSNIMLVAPSNGCKFLFPEASTSLPFSEPGFTILTVSACSTVSTCSTISAIFNHYVHDHEQITICDASHGKGWKPSTDLLFITKDSLLNWCSYIHKTIIMLLSFDYWYF